MAAKKLERGWVFEVQMLHTEGVTENMGTTVVGRGYARTTIRIQFSFPTHSSSTAVLTKDVLHKYSQA